MQDISDSSKPTCCDSNTKPVQGKTQQASVQAVSGTQAQNPVTPPEKPIAPQPKPKSCCG